MASLSGLGLTIEEVEELSGPQDGDGFNPFQHYEIPVASDQTVHLRNEGGSS